MVLAPAIALLGTRGSAARLWTLGEIRARVPVDRTADRARRRASDTDPARCHRHVDGVRAAAASRARYPHPGAGPSPRALAPQLVHGSGLRYTASRCKEPPERPAGGNVDETVRRAAPPVRRTWLSVFPELLLRRRDRADAHRGRSRSSSSIARKCGARNPAHRAPRSRRTSSTTCSGCWRITRAWSTPLRAGVRRAALRPPVQAQRQGGVRGRRLAVASGLRHLGARRRHAGAARDEHRGLPRRGVSVQRRADAGAGQPQGRHARRPGTIYRPHPIRSGRSIRRP